MTMKQYMKMSKPALIRKITKALRVMPKKKLAVLCYNITKSKLPSLKLKRIKGYKIIPAAYGRAPSYQMLPKKKKRTFTKRQLAAQRLFAKRARAGTFRKRRRR